MPYTNTAFFIIFGKIVISLHVYQHISIALLPMEDICNKTITEIAPLRNKCDSYAVKREKISFDYPVHRHDAYEINFIYGGKGARRIVGDSIEEIEDFDLVFIGPGIEHGWETYHWKALKMHEITIQFGTEFYVDEFLKNNNLHNTLRLLKQSSNGVAFGIDTVLNSYHLLVAVTQSTTSFDRLFNCCKLVEALSDAKDTRTLVSSTFSGNRDSYDSRRITKVQTYIGEHITERIRLIELANIAGMTESSFSRFFKLRTGFSVSDYIMNMRLGEASRRLADTDMTISEICYICGFNNVSHFCRCFREHKNLTPSEFRSMYKRNH